MREIKFRAWDDSQKKWIRLFSIENDGSFLEFDDGEYHVRWTENIIIMQYTGLKDKNGKEIFEGDVIQYDNERYEVYWSEEWAMFAVRGCQIQALMRYASYGEVIGNRYANPDLLKSQQVNITQPERA